MKFLFVDKITKLADPQIEGEINFEMQSPLRCSGPDGEPIIAPSVIGEGIGQLIAWLIMEKKDFQFRPVYVFSDEVEIFKPVRPGSKVELKSWLDRIDDESFVFSGEAWCNGELIQRVNKCTNFFMKLEEMEDPAVCRERFARLCAAGENYADQGTPFDFDGVVKSFDLSEDGRSVETKCQVDPKAPFYADHFPRFPVTPIVVLNEIIGRSMAKLFSKTSAYTVFPSRVRKLKIKSFVKPGEDFQIKVKLKPAQEGSDLFSGIVTVTKESKKILQGEYEFKRYEVK